MKRPRPDERGPMAHRSHRPIDETIIDATRPAGSGSVGQQAGPSAIQVSIATDIGRVRRNNEDYVQAERFVRDGRRYSMWAVADGVGGGPQGERASKTAVETVVDYLAHEPWADPTVALTEAFALANRNVYEITGEGAAASTLVVALVSDPEGVVCIANVGDSRAYIVAGGEARQITDDHSIVAARVAAGQITAAEARTAPDRNVLTRSIGSERETLVDVFGPRQLLPLERLVLCTDGVHGMIDDAAIGRLGGGLPIAESAGALVAAAVEAGGKDNATALVGGYAQGGAFAGASAGAFAIGGSGALLGAPTDRTQPTRRHGMALGLILVSSIVAGLALVGLLAFVVVGGSPSVTSPASPSPVASPTFAVSPSQVQTDSPTPTAITGLAASLRPNATPYVAPPPKPVVTPKPTPVVSTPTSAPTTPPKPVIICNGNAGPLTVKLSDTVSCSWTNPWTGSSTQVWVLSTPSTNPGANPATLPLVGPSAWSDGPGAYWVQLHVTVDGVELVSNQVDITVTP